MDVDADLRVRVESALDALFCKPDSEGEVSLAALFEQMEVSGDQVVLKAQVGALLKDLDDDNSIMYRKGQIHLI